MTVDKEAVRAANRLEDVFPALLGVPLPARRNGRELSVPCFMHSDGKRPNLRVNLAEQKFYCDVCQTGGDVFRLVELAQKVDFPAALRWLGDRAGVADQAEPRIAAVYDYTDEAGTLLYQVVRREPKDFRQRRPDGRGGWLWNMNGVRRVLYRLPQLRGHQGVAIVEGEKDVDRLWDLTLPATTNAGGAGKWLDEYPQQLAAAGVARVVLIPDNDGPGREHMSAVAASCAAAGLVVKVLSLPDIPSKGDVSDYLATHDRQDLVGLMRAAPLYDGGKSDGAVLGPVVVRVADVAAQRISWLWRRRLALGKLTLLMGDPGVGKSFITVDLTSRITRGSAWPDGGVAAAPGNVVFLAVEDGIADTIRPRLERAGADLTRVFVFTTIRDENGERLPNFERDMGTLEQVIVEHKPSLVVVDPVSSYLGKSDSYKDADMRRVLAPLALLADKHQVAVLSLVHMTKGSKEGKALYRAMGSIAFAALARIVLAAGSDPEQPDRCYLMPVKQNICAPADTLAYRLDPDPDDSDGAARLAWEGAPVEGIRPDAILGATAAGDRDQQQDAAEFLQQLLADGRMRADDIFQAGKRNGYSDSTLNRAKRRSGVRSFKEGFREGVWYWELDPKISPKISTSEDLTTFGGNPTVTPLDSAALSKIVTSPLLTTFVQPSEDDPEVGLV